MKTSQQYTLNDKIFFIADAGALEHIVGKMFILNNLKKLTLQTETNELT